MQLNVYVITQDKELSNKLINSSGDRFEKEEYNDSTLILFSSTDSWDCIVEDITKLADDDGIFLLTATGDEEPFAYFALREGETTSIGYVDTNNENISNEQYNSFPHFFISWKSKLPIFDLMNEYWQELNVIGYSYSDTIDDLTGPARYPEQWYEENPRPTEFVTYSFFWDLSYTEHLIEGLSNYSNLNDRLHIFINFVKSYHENNSISKKKIR